VNVVDPWTVDEIAYEARLALAGRYVSIWWAEDQIALVIGVHAPTEADMVFLRAFTARHWVVAVELPVSRAEVDAARTQADVIAGDDFVGISSDYQNGRVDLGVALDQVGRVVERINASDNGLLAVASSEAIPESIPGQVVVVVEPAAPSHHDD